MPRRRAAGVAVLVTLALVVLGGLWLRSTRSVDALGVERPILIREPGSTVYTAPTGILFDVDSAVLTASAIPSLRGIVADITRAGLDGTVQVEGYTDDVGPEGYNLGLSDARAQAVADWLVQYGHLTESRIQVVGLGEGYPVAPNDTDEHRRANRRVVIAVQR